MLLDYGHTLVDLVRPESELLNAYHTINQRLEQELEREVPQAAELIQSVSIAVDDAIGDSYRTGAEQEVDIVELGHDVARHLGAGHLVAGAVSVGGIEADPDAVAVRLQPPQQLGELLEAAADVVAGAGRVLQQQPRRALDGNGLQGALHRRDDVLVGSCQAAALVAADVDDDVVQTVGRPPLQLVGEGGARLGVDRLLRPGHVDQVVGVADDGLHPGFTKGPGEGPGHPWVDHLRAPGGGVAGEDLDRLSAELTRRFDRRREATVDADVEPDGRRQTVRGLGVGAPTRAARRATRAAAAPAPMPLSMLTTVTPGEQVCSIPSSAARPWPPAP